jgi:peroxiredoxin
MGDRLSILGVATALLVAACAATAVEGTAVEPRGSLASPSTDEARAAAERSETTSEAAVDSLPGVALSTLAGGPAQVGDVADGRPALVTLWATWCEACEKEMDALNRLHDGTRGGRDAVVIGVAVGEEPAHVAAFARARGLRYEQLVDPRFAFADALGQRRLPATFVVDRRGRIVYRGDALDAQALGALRRAIATP